MDRRIIRRIISVFLVIVLAVVFSLTTEYFLSLRNILQLFREASFVGLTALGMSFVIIGGGIDLSVGGIICAVGIVCARLSFIPGIPGIIVVIGAIIAGAACGAFNAFLVAKLQLTEFVATLASGFAFSGLALLLAFRDNGTILSKTITNRSFLAFGRHIGGLYYITIVWVVLTTVAFWVMTRTKFGLHTYALGSNAKSAQMSGVNNKKVKSTGFLICGATAGLTAAMVSAYQSASPVTLGTGMEFQAIAACVVGGIVLGGGRGDSIGAFIGGLFMSLILNGIYKYSLPIAWQTILQGAIIILVTAFDAQFSKITILGSGFRKKTKHD